MIIETEQTTEAAVTSRAVDFIERVLMGLVDNSESDTARIQAAKILLERLSENREGEAVRHGTEERNAALAEARCLLDEFAETLAARNLCAQCAATLAEGGSAGTDNAGAVETEQPLS